MNPYSQPAAKTAKTPMHSGPRLRPAALAAREKLAEGRAKLKAQHDRGSPGIQVSAGLTTLLDSIVVDLYRAALEATATGIESLMALVPLGGYGRGDLAPFSDIDLMLMHQPGADRKITAFVRTLTQDIFDASHNWRIAKTPVEAEEQDFSA